MEKNDYETILESVTEGGGFTYRKVLRVDLEKDRCIVLKSDLDGWQPGEGPVTDQMAQFALSGAIHQQDVERFVTFTRLDQMRLASVSGKETLSMIYRRKVDDGFRWNLMEVIPDRGGDTRFVILCVKDVDDVLREGAEREGLTPLGQEVMRNLEDRAYIISSMSSLFFSIYYIDLEQDIYRAVTQLSRVGDVLGDEMNYTAALSIYANHFIHPDDRAEYLRVMDVQHLRDVLRWWQPIVAVEYRKLPEDPKAGAECWNWVRSSVVLARMGDNDLPKTAVYVAQDITDGRRS